MATCPACNQRYDANVTFCSKDGSQLVPDQQAEADDGLVGQVIADRYRLTKKLGEGGMGEVYEAQHIYIEKRVALKLLRPEIMSNQEAVSRFYQEARAASQIGHENIVSIDDFGKLPDGRVYLSMELLAGESLNDALQQPMELGRALDIVIQVCKGLAAAHAKNIVHRDMKPENIFLVRHEGQEVAKILDFGIAKVSGTEGNQHLTRTGTIFGTPHYMSPEQALGKALDRRTDIYSVGVIMYEMFTGSVPFKAESFMGILTQHLTTMPKAPHEQAPERQIPLAVESVILKAMAKNADERYQKIEDLLADLQQIQRDLQAGLPLGGTTVAQPAFAPGPPPPGLPGPVASGVMTTPRPAAPPPPGAPPPWAGAPSGAVAMPPTSPMPVPSTLPPPGIPAPLPMSTPYGSTGTMPAARPKSGGGMVIGIVIGAVVLLGGGGGAVWYFQNDIFGADGPQKAKTVGGPVAKVGGPATKVPPPVKTPPPQLQWTRVQVTSTPMDAAIVHDGKEIGKTPAFVKVPPDRPIRYTIRLAGYEDKTLDLAPGDTAKKHLMLEKVGGAPAPKPKAKPKAGQKPSGDPYERLQ
jgi:serine/threonine-protein kinase